MNYVTSCHQVESCVLAAPVSTVWEAFRTFNLAQLFPSSVKSINFTNGNANEVGSTFTVEYVDGSSWTYRLLEISESRRVLSFELLSAEPQVEFSSLLTVFRFLRVTENNSTYFAWESDYSNDINSHVVQDGKFKKLDSFKDLRAKFN
jgi:hypothetical protein